jgi:hypothetical protein
MVQFLHPTETELRTEHDQLQRVLADCEIPQACPCHLDKWERLDTVRFLLVGFAPRNPTLDDAIQELRHAVQHPEQIPHIPLELLALILAELEKDPAPTWQHRRDWRHCSPDLLNTGVDCAAATRRPCTCFTGGSHDHLVWLATEEDSDT